MVQPLGFLTDYSLSSSYSIFSFFSFGFFYIPSSPSLLFLHTNNYRLNAMCNNPQDRRSNESLLPVVFQETFDRPLVHLRSFSSRVLCSLCFSYHYFFLFFSLIYACFLMFQSLRWLFVGPFVFLFMLWWSTCLYTGNE